MPTKIRRDGEAGTILLPEGMTWDQARKAIDTQQELDNYGEKQISIVEIIDRFPFEAAYALKKAAEELFGTSLHHDKVEHDSIVRAELIGVPVSVTEIVQVPWGPFHLPDIEGELETKFHEENGRVIMAIQARVKHKYRDAIAKLAARTREIGEKESIYRGKAIRVHFRGESGKLDMIPPTFMEISSGHRPIFGERVTHEINKHLLLPIRQADKMRQLKLPAKRGILLSGTYGCGKTLTAYMVAKEAVEAGRTFIYVQDASELMDALRFAASYQPALVFVEDVDRIVFGKRNSKTDALLNTVDGVDTKDVDIISVITTNNIELIHPAFLRHGRVDKIIAIDELDVYAVEALIRHFAGDLLDEKTAIRQLAAKLTDRTAAFVREIVENAKLEALSNNQDGEIHLTTQDLEIAFHNIKEEREHVMMYTTEVQRLQYMVEELQAAGVLGKK